MKRITKITSTHTHPGTPLDCDELELDGVVPGAAEYVGLLAGWDLAECV
jgi:hypothetical protein